MDELELKKGMHVLHVLFGEIEICDNERGLIIFRNEKGIVRKMSGKILALYCKPIFNETLEDNNIKKT